MQTKTPSLRSVAAPFAFAGMCVILAIITWITFGGSVPLQAQGYQLRVVLPEATSVYPGSQVQMSGVQIGKVHSVNLTRAGVQVTLELDRRYAPMHRGAHVTLRTKTLLGEGYVQLAPGPSNEPAVPDGGTLPTSQVLAQQPLQAALETFAPATRRRIAELFSGVSRAFAGRSQALSDSLGTAGPATENLTAVLAVLDTERPSLQALVANAGTAFQALGQRQGALQTAVTAGNDMLATMAAERKGLGATLDALPPFLRTLRSAASSLGSLSTTLTPAVRALQPAVPKLEPALRAIDAAAPPFRALFEGLPAALRAGDLGLPGLTGILRATPPAFAQVYAAARQLIPIAQLASASRGSLIGSFANLGNVMNGTMLLANGQSAHVADGLPTFWNETISGWSKRLPTNRMNAYPTTANLGGEATRGALEAYDCRNLHNIAYLPPFGTGTPPCLVQGSYIFDGRRGEYPRLYLAPR
jgi:phospholipid/cholesterol/gamma-HCH transport system substrate-binding protein